MHSQAQEQRITEREGFIRDLSTKHRMKGYEQFPLEREKVVEFISELGDKRNRQNTETENLQVRLSTQTLGASYQISLERTQGQERRVQRQVKEAAR